MINVSHMYSILKTQYALIWGNLQMHEEPYWNDMRWPEKSQTLYKSDTWGLYVFEWYPVLVSELKPVNLYKWNMTHEQLPLLVLAHNLTQTLQLLKFLFFFLTLSRSEYYQEVIQLKAQLQWTSRPWPMKIACHDSCCGRGQGPWSATTSITIRKISLPVVFRFMSSSRISLILPQGLCTYCALPST